MFNIVLVHPEIPPNTGNIIRLAANTGCTLHLIEPLGFPLDDAKLRRAGLDYHEFASVRVHAGWPRFLATERPAGERMFALTTRGETPIGGARFICGDWFVFGSETRGLDAGLLAEFEAARRLRLPMRPASRSLNLSNSVAVTVFEAWRQNDFAGGV